MTAGFTGGLGFSRQNITVSPIVFETIEEVKSLSGLGKTNPLIDTTSFDSAAREYIAGLSDGSEISVECVRVHTASSNQDDLISDVDNNLTSTFQLVITNSLVSPNLVRTYTFSAVCLSWTITPSFDDAHMIAYSLKISGDITVT